MFPAVLLQLLRFIISSVQKTNEQTKLADYLLAGKVIKERMKIIKFIPTGGQALGLKDSQ